ncbi:MAG: NUDIX hydrolase [Gammaproteobacteria bacterium]|nr:NUDIX hydrolase [Gammaproteobacteria bacterium]
MKYCCECASPVIVKIPEGDTFPRYVCEHCHTIHYQNPKIITGCIATWEEKILLCRRAIEPRYGKWTLPAGFMENNETTQQGAARETLEEAQAVVSDLQLFGVFNIPHISQVYMIFHGHATNDFCAPTHESLEAHFFNEENIPWNELAFPTVHECLKLYFADKKNHQLTVHFGDILRDKQNKVAIRRYS